VAELLADGEFAAAERKKRETLEATFHAQVADDQAAVAIRNEWRSSQTFADLLATFDGVPISRQGAHALADAGFDLERCRGANDAELLAIHGHRGGNGIGAITVAKLRLYLDALDAEHRFNDSRPTGPALSDRDIPPDR
jgi:hypothetical protein